MANMNHCDNNFTAAFCAELWKKLKKPITLA